MPDEEEADYELQAGLFNWPLEPRGTIQPSNGKSTLKILRLSNLDICFVAKGIVICFLVQIYSIGHNDHQCQVSWMCTTLQIISSQSVDYLASRIRKEGDRLHLYSVLAILKPQGLRQNRSSLHLGNGQFRVINMQVSVGDDDEASKHRLCIKLCKFVKFCEVCPPPPAPRPIERSESVLFVNKSCHDTYNS